MILASKLNQYLVHLSFYKKPLIMKKVLFIICFFTFASLSQSGIAQVETPAPSPVSTLTQKVGLSEVVIEYSRPGMKDRKIFGSLVPYGEMWRTGANGSTDVTFSDDVTIHGTVLKAGKYALYTIPSEGEWTIIFHSNSDYWGTGGDEYDAAGEVLRFETESKELPFDVESFTMGVNNIGNSGADLLMYWEKTFVAFPFTFDTDEKVMATIKSTMEGPSANDYYKSARYFLDSGKDLGKAHKWITKATKMRDDAFWMFRIKSMIEAKMGDYPVAIETAKKSMELAEKAGNKQYVKFNEDAIAEWSMK